MGDTEPVIEDGANGVQDPVQECTDLINNRGCVKQFVNGGNNILIYISLLAYLENCTLPTMGNGHRTSFVPCNAELLVKCPKNFLKNYQLKMMQSKHNLIKTSDKEMNKEYLFDIKKCLYLLNTDCLNYIDHK